MPDRFPNEKNFFDTRRAATNFCGELEEARRRLDSAVVALTEAQQFEAAECFGLLTPRGRSLREEVNFFLAHLNVSERSALVPVVAEEFLAEKRTAGVSTAHLAPLVSRVNAFAASHPDTVISSPVVSSDFRLALRTLPPPRHPEQRLPEHQNLFGFAKGRKYLADIPSISSSTRRSRSATSNP